MVQPEASKLCTTFPCLEIEHIDDRPMRGSDESFVVTHSRYGVCAKVVSLTTQIDRVVLTAPEAMCGLLMSVRPRRRYAVDIKVFLDHVLELSKPVFSADKPSHTCKEVKVMVLL
jgi:hypothetical protein